MMQQVSEGLKLKEEYYSQLDKEYLFTVRSGLDVYRVCIRLDGRNLCTCPYGYIHKYDEGKKCKHEKAVLRRIKK